MNIQTVPTKSQCVEVGTIVRPHGREGEVLVSIKNVDIDDFKDLSYLFFCLQERLVPFFIQTVSFKNNSVFIQFEDIHTMERAEMYVGTKLYLEAENCTSEEKIEQLELEGFTVIDAASQKEIGIIQEVISYSMNIVLDVKCSDGNSVLLPLADELIKECDESGRRLVLTIPDGIIE
ncbi:MAG: 16S rRNA processing protein RimM [Bacteroidales bacterium]|nr:16S rRNA processing protein RimM [Bacteroidales bacterium]